MVLEHLAEFAFYFFLRRSKDSGDCPAGSAANGAVLVVQALADKLNSSSRLRVADIAEF